jgi:ribose transport system permease protein
MTDLSVPGRVPGDAGSSRYVSATERVRQLLRHRTAGVVGALIVLATVLSLASPFFLRADNLLDISRQMAVLALMAIGVSFVLIAGQIDLSVGSTYGMAAVSFAWLVAGGTPVFAAVVLCLLLGAGIGVANGILCAYLQLPSFIVTLGMLQLVRGLALTFTDGAPISLFGISTPDMELFTFFGQGRLFDVLPMQFVVLLAVLAVTAFVLHGTRPGLQFFAVGSSRRAALLAGIPVARVQTFAFVVSGLLAALGGLLAVAFIPNATPTAGSGLEFAVFAAAVLGGVSLFGGQGSVVGAVLGAAILATLRNGLVVLGVSSFVQTSVTGVVIIVAIAVNVLISRDRRG